jgi:hypothetical protein
MSADPQLVSEADVILPPPTALNPIPELDAALRLDNQDQLLEALQSNPLINASGGGGDTNFRQLLVFGTNSLRTLLLRQVLQDPHKRQFKGKQTKKNWDGFNTFQYPKSIASTIVGTRLLQNSIDYQPNELFITHTMSSGAAEVTFDGNNDEFQHVDVVTYFVRPWDLSHTSQVAKQIHGYKKKAFHRLIYIPQPTALVSQVLQDLGLTSAPHVSIQSLQLDLFPLETDVFSLEYESATKEESVEGTPSTLVTTCARAVLKLQDITGTIPRIQSIGMLSEKVLDRFLNQSVDDYLNSEEERPQDEEFSQPIDDNHLAMIFFDRKIDMVTPMVTPLTYEGLLDEVVGIDCG